MTNFELNLGLSDKGFLSSIEQFDKSSASWNVPLQRDWRIINHVLNSPRYEMAVASIPVHKVGVCIFVFENQVNKNKSFQYIPLVISIIYSFILLLGM